MFDLEATRRERDEPCAIGRGKLSGLAALILRLLRGQLASADCPWQDRRIG